HAGRHSHQSPDGGGAGLLPQAPGSGLRLTGSPQRRRDAAEDRRKNKSKYEEMAQETPFRYFGFDFPALLCVFLRLCGERDSLKKLSEFNVVPMMFLSSGRIMQLFDGWVVAKMFRPSGLPPKSKFFCQH